MQTRTCRDCGEEYRLDAQIAECTDCGGPIEWRDETSPGAAAPAAHPEGPYRLVYGSDQPAELEPLAKRLGEAKIPFGVRAGTRHRFELWVPAVQVKAAREALSVLLGTATTGAEDALVLETGRRCPACDAEITGSEPDCLECGLAIGALEPPACPECGAPGDPDEGPCPSCGH